MIGILVAIIGTLALGALAAECVGDATGANDLEEAGRGGRSSAWSKGLTDHGARRTFAKATGTWKLPSKLIA